MCFRALTGAERGHHDAGGSVAAGDRSGGWEMLTVEWLVSPIWESMPRDSIGARILFSAYCHATANRGPDGVADAELIEWGGNHTTELID